MSFLVRSFLVWKDQKRISAPGNVSVVCNNFQTVVSWTYSQQLLDPLFRVYISPMATSQGRTEGNVTTRDLQYNLTGDVWKSFMSSRDVYTVYVSAVSGDQESTRTAPQRFTFNQLHESHVKIPCTLDLPPVEVLVNGQVATISFDNPMKIHPELRWAADIVTSDPLVLRFDVTEDNVTQQGECRAHKLKCTLEFFLPSKKEKHCLSLKASLHNSIQKVLFNEKDPICGQNVAVPGTHWLFLALLLALFTLVVCGVGFMVWKSKACVQSLPSSPSFLDPKSWTNQQKNTMAQMEHFISASEHSHLVTVTQKPSDPDADGFTQAGDQETLSVDLSSEGPGSSCPSAGYCAGSEGSEEALEGEGGEEDPEGEGGEGVPELAYDQPHFPLFDMGAGDMVRGYGL
ncbi:unnamed protein product [Lota lota]